MAEHIVEMGVKGLHCGGCVTRLTRILEGLEGVEKAEVSLSEAQVKVTFAPDKANPSSVKEAIEDAGFYPA